MCAAGCKSNISNTWSTTAHCYLPLNTYRIIRNRNIELFQCTKFNGRMKTLDAVDVSPTTGTFHSPCARADILSGQAQASGSAWCRKRARHTGPGWETPWGTHGAHTLDARDTALSAAVAAHSTHTGQLLSHPECSLNSLTHSPLPLYLSLFHSLSP